MSMVREFGGTVAGVRDRVTGLFTNRDNGPTADEPVA